MFAIFLTSEMDPFYRNIASFPTAIFTVLLGISTLYWVIAILGLVDIHGFDIDLPEADGIDGLTNTNVLAGLLLRFGLEGVPVTIIVTLISLFGWFICYYLAYFLLGFTNSGFVRFVGGVPIVAGALYVSTMIAAQVIKPLRPLFRNASQPVEKQVLGQTAVVRTSRVDAESGEAVLEDGGAGLILKVRATGSETFVAGDRVVLLEYLQQENAYRVLSEKEFSGL